MRSTRLVSACLLLAALAALPGCTADGSESPGATGGGDDAVEYKGPPPQPTAEFETAYKGDGLPGGNSWELGVERGQEARFTVRMTVRAGGQVCRTTFLISELHAPSSETVRELRDDRRTLGPGTYAYQLGWDGTDDHAQPLPLGRYRLRAELATHPRHCDRPMTSEGSGLGQLLLGEMEGEPRYVPPAPV